MNDNTIRYKIEKSIELICLLYKNNLIIDAHIVGSVTKGTAVKESDIDIVIINPEFKESYDQLMPQDIFADQLHHIQITRDLC